MGVTDEPTELAAFLKRSRKYPSSEKKAFFAVNKLEKKARYEVSRPACPHDPATLFHWPSLLERGVPILSYSAVVCDVTRTPGDSPNSTLWTSWKHPGSSTHAVVATIVAAALSELAPSSCQGELSPREPNCEAQVRWRTYLSQQQQQKAAAAAAAPQAHQSERACMVSPRTFMTAAKPSTFSPEAAGTAWVFGEDVAGKPGWIARGAGDCDNCDATARDIEFAVEIGPARLIILTLLKTYSAEWGKLMCQVCAEPPSDTSPSSGIPHCDQLHIIGSRWPKRESQADLARIPVANHSTLQGKHVRLQCTTDGGKFKLLEIATC